MFKNKIYLPIAFALVLIAGIMLGNRLSLIRNFNGLNISISGSKVISTTYDYIINNYVDSLSEQELEKIMLSSTFEELDPHSAYISNDDFEEMNDPLKGNFEGIGVQFRIEKDTVMVVKVISGGPSEKSGLKDGDRIVSVENDTIANIKIKNNDVIKKLKGKKGTKVKLGIHRRGVDDLIYYTVTRDVIPTYSVDVSYMPSKHIGYIKLSRFSATSHHEVMKAIKELQAKGMEKLILDLRGNSGGYLRAAIELSDEFLDDKKLIVYTEGLHRSKQMAYASDNGLFEKNPLVILIDEGSASASEILAGAIQDNDRGTIIGRRSFGKGLVQEQVQLSNGSAIRLTVSRYYTPTGRCIQRPYKDGKEDYYMDIVERWENGEMLSADSIHFNDSLIYLTPKGDTVYGGGGIMPDIYVPIPTVKPDDLMNKLHKKGLFYQFTFDYADTHRKALKKYKTADAFLKDYEISADVMKKFLNNARKEGIKFDNQQVNINRTEIKNLLKALIGQNIFGSDAFYPFYLKDDEVFKRAIKELS